MVMALPGHQPATTLAVASTSMLQLKSLHFTYNTKFVFSNNNVYRRPKGICLSDNFNITTESSPSQFFRLGNKKELQADDKDF